MSPKQPTSGRVFPRLWGPNADYEALDWQPFREGVDIFPLYGARGHGAATRGRLAASDVVQAPSSRWRA